MARIPWRAIPGAVVKSRLVQFLAVGGLLAALAPRADDGRAIVIDASRVENALQGERVRHGRALTGDEKNAVVAGLVDEEVLAREAVRLGIGTEDVVIRSRLAERMNASYADALPPPRIDEDELAVAIGRAIGKAPQRTRLAVWFVAKDRASAEHATRTADELAAAIRRDGFEKARGRGDRSPLPDDTVWTEEALARTVGTSAAHRAFETPIGTATEPLPSAWGFYVFVPLERRAATNDEVRAEALADLVATKQASDVAKLVRRARRDFTISVKTPEGESPFDIDAPSLTLPKRVD